MKTLLGIPYIFALAVLLAGCASPVAAPLEPTALATSAETASPYPIEPAASAAPALISPYPQSTDSSAIAYPSASQPAKSPDTPYPATTADTPGTGDEPWLPQASDAGLEQGQAFVEEAQVLTLERMPPQFRLQVSGNLPTPCHILRMEIAPPDAQKSIEVRVYSVVKADMLCVQVLEPFQVSAPLKDLPTGQYTVEVNGKTAGTIDVP